MSKEKGTGRPGRSRQPVDLSNLSTLRDLGAPREPAPSVVRSAEDVFRLDPKLIEREGFYVRQAKNDDIDERFREAVKDTEDVGQAIGVRTVGPPSARRYVLVYGMRRLDAALAAGLDHVLVRSHRDIDEREALLLQMQENHLRREMEVPETAMGLYLLTEQGRTQKEIAAALGKAKSYVSEMVRAGAAVAQLAEDERERLLDSRKGTVKLFQEIAKVEPLARRVDALRDVIAGQTPSEPGVDRAQKPPTGPVQVKAHRSGRSIRVRWRDKDLRQAPEAFVANVAGQLAQELLVMAEQASSLHATRSGERADVVDARVLKALRVLAEQRG